jgi:two-component system NarL family sensor kinase
VNSEAGGAHRRAAAGAHALVAACFGLALTGLVLHLLPGRVDAGDFGAWWITDVIGAMAVALPAGLVAARRPSNPLGWLLLGLALASGVTVASREYALHALAPGSGLPGGTGALWVSTWTYADFPFLVALVFLFPEGRLLSRRWVPAFAIGLGAAALAVVWLAVEPGPMLPSGRPLNPLPWPWLYDLIARLGQTILVVNLAAVAVGLVTMLLRARSVTGTARRQIVLVAIATLILVSEIGHEDFAYYAGAVYVGAAVTVLFVVCMAVAILHYRLYEIDLVVSRTLVYGGLTIVLGAAYVGIVVLADTVTPDRIAGSVPAAVVVALLFAPVRERLQQTSDRLLFGDREDPYAVISTVSQQLDGEHPGQILPALAATVAQTLKLPYVAIELDHDDGRELAAEHGHPRGEPVALPLTYGGREIGRIGLGPRSPTERFTSAERRLFTDIARQVAVAAHAVQLGEDLRRSSGRLVVAREEERRRVRRDLHDGLGPTLAGISLQIASARVLLDRDPAAADTLLATLVAETQGAIAEIRRLVYDLRPPALDELGLIPALRMQAERFPGLEIRVEAAETIGDLPAAVEVAAYRIATEALTNVSRHAAARVCTVSIAVNGHLELEVSDDGSGLHADWAPGIGLTSIRERASELGGTCVIETARSGGTRVLARLPLPQPG